MSKENFEIEFHSEEEMEEMMDSIVAAIGKQIEDDGNKTMILNPVRVMQIKFAYGVLKFLLKDQNVKMSVSLNEPFVSVGSIHAEGMNFVFFNSEWFSRVAEFASNVDIYPLVNGKVSMTLTFHNITKPIK